MSGGTPQVMTLGLTSRWRQDSPYNDLCPVLTTGTDEHTVVGCCPLAMAQTMYYWKWPSTGSGSRSRDYERWFGATVLEEPLANDPGIPLDWPWLDFNGNPRLQWYGGNLRMAFWWDDSLWRFARNEESHIIDYDDPTYRTALDNLWSRIQAYRYFTSNSADFGATTYDWTLMQDAHYDPPDAGDAEVAKLCYHCGIAQQAYWGIKLTTQGSVPPAMSAMATYFRYDPDAHDATFSADNVVEEISWLRPSIMYGSGHVVVIVGYDVSGAAPLLQINTGWGYDDWYTLDQAWPSGRSMGAQLAPVNVKFVGAADAGDGTPSDPYRNIEEAIDEAPDGATLIFKAGSVNTFAAATLVIDHPCTLKGWNVTIQKQ
jgi:hypothetical protein